MTETTGNAGNTGDQTLTESAHASPQNAFAFDSLEAVRKKLLDLTGRNVLINYKHPKTSSIRIIDELPDQLFEILSEGRKLAFDAVPEPTLPELEQHGFVRVDPETKQKVVVNPSAEAWAKVLGIDTSYDLPEGGAESSLKASHSDTNIQTLLYAPQMEARLRGLRGKAETAIEENGANIIFINFGFLEWFESKDSDVSRIAPLFSIPVRLEREKLDKTAGVFRYSITIKDEGIVTNITLREKLANDFDLILPEIKDDETPEQYFENIKNNILHHKPRWKLLRRATLLLLNFTKQAMYEDLNPKNWPVGHSISEHPLIKQFFSSGSGDEKISESGYWIEHEIDKIEEIHSNFPLIYDADSSQHSALIDAVNGKSLVIEGPPGSGKSQTITNLIAACINNGQRVLFVAEKMAALNVVKKRLDQAGLGDFCLELHSHKTNKREIIDNLASRLINTGTYANPEELGVITERYEKYRNDLHSYVNLINSTWKETGITLHTILNRATRLRQKLDINPELLTLEGLNGADFTPLKLQELADSSETLKNIYTQVTDQAIGSKIENHHWYGALNTDLAGFKINEFIDSLSDWNAQLINVNEIWVRTLTSLNINADENVDMEDLSAFSSLVMSLPDLKGKEPLEKMEAAFDLVDDIDDYLIIYKYIHTANDDFAKVFNSPAINDITVAKKLIDAIANLEKTSISVEASPHAIKKLCNDLTQSSLNISEIRSILTEIEGKVPVDLRPATKISEDGIVEFLKLIEFIKKLPSDLWRHRDYFFYNAEIDEMINSLKREISAMSPLHNKLSENFNLLKLPSVEVLSSLKDTLENSGPFRIFKPSYNAAKKEILSISFKPKSIKTNLIAITDDLILYSRHLREADRINNLHDSALGELYKGAETPLDKIETLRSWYRELGNEYGKGFGDRVTIGKAISALDRSVAVAIIEAYENHLADKLKQLITTIETTKRIIAIPVGFEIKTSNLGAESCPFKNLKTSLLNHNDLLIDHVLDHNISLKIIELECTKLHKLNEIKMKWIDHNIANFLFNEKNKLSEKVDHYSEDHYDSLLNFKKIISIAAENKNLKQALINSNNTSDYISLKKIGLDIQDLTNNTSALKAKFLMLGKVNYVDWIESTKSEQTLLIDRNLRALANPAWLQTWLDYVGLRKKLSTVGLGNIITKLEVDFIKSEQISDVVQLAISNQLAMEILNEHEELAMFNGLEQSAIRDMFSKYDRELLSLQRKKIAHEASNVMPARGIASGRVRELTQTSLILHVAGQKKPRISVRGLLHRADSAIQTLKPCFMMSPMSVAQYLKPGAFKFDIVIMDEASQIRPEDALGAIARGTSLVVVGDPKQLPPSSFFDKISNEEETDDTVILQDSESILESVSSLFRMRRLRWHYRSRHESLIAFSNKHFYDSDLVLFPSPFQESNEFGIRFTRVKTGRFVNRRNIEEAKEVVTQAANQLINNPAESVGIVAMSADQREEIERILEQQVKDNPILKAAFDSNAQQPDPIFIKNLENVQGDQRDVIIISMTYGPEQVGGRTMQRFGPINSDVGWRRLNVLFTRSQKRMHIISSMGSGDILISDTSKLGIKSLKAFLEYCESGHLHNSQRTGKTADSDFELSVMAELYKHGYESEPQLGVAGFYLDLAVKDPGNPGRYIMGVECDGATYHSAKSTRDRDRLRQDILESLGWEIKRIWSTDWFKNPEAQLQPILNRLAELSTPINEPTKIVEEGLSFILNDTTLHDYDSKVNDTPQNQTLTSETAEPNSPESGLWDISLKQRLITYKTMTINPDCPGTDPEKMLLRPAMIEALLNHRPFSKAEFLECIPSYLRTGTDISEGKFLEGVLEVIAQYG